MNYVKVVNKAEILLYSTLISVMSGINQLKNQAQDTSDYPASEIVGTAPVTAKTLEYTPAKAAAFSWWNIQQTFLSLLLWTMLGLAAGFLIGMLKHG